MEKEKVEKMNDFYSKLTEAYGRDITAILHKGGGSDPAYVKLQKIGAKPSINTIVSGIDVEGRFTPPCVYFGDKESRYLLSEIEKRISDTPYEPENTYLILDLQSYLCEGEEPEVAGAMKLTKAHLDHGDLVVNLEICNEDTVKSLSKTVSEVFKESKTNLIS